MSRNSYNNIKKYAAFLFMVFTVLSGSSEVMDSDGFARISRKAFIDMFATSSAFIQDGKTTIAQSRTGYSEDDRTGFRSFLDSNVEDLSLSHIQVYILLIVFVYYFNNLILKNSIWKNAVF